MTVSDGARDARGTIDAASAGELETVVHTYEGTQANINSQSTGGNINPERENVEGPGAPESKSGKAKGRGKTKDGVHNGKMRIREAGNTSKA